MKYLIALFCGLLLPSALAAAAPKDLSHVRGFNYTPASVDNEQLYLQYDDAEVNRDFGYAQSIGLNQVRAFLRYTEWAKDKAKFHDSFGKLLAAVRRHNMQIMFVLSLPREPSGVLGTTADEQREAWLRDVLTLAKGHKEVFAWDVANEPDWSGYSENPVPPAARDAKIEMGKKIADFVHKFDKNYLTTVGCFRVECIETYAAYTDILSWHDYAPTRELTISRALKAKEYAARYGKPLLQTEVGCIGRASPYDMALREYKKLGVGTYIWELMVTKRWGTIHGVFYPDGTVRDPTIAAAVMGIFRNEGDDRILEVPDQESWLTMPLQRSAKWLAAKEPDWKEGLEIAEMEANMVEGNQLAPMRFPPTLAIQKLRAGAPNLPALRATMEQYVAILTPFAGLGRLHGN